MRVGFIGLGVQGKHLALNLCAAGHEVTVFDLRPEPLAELAAVGAKVASSPREAAASAEVTATCVLDDAQTRAVILGEDGVLAGARPGSIVLIHSTVSPSTVLELAALAEKRGVNVLDAPVSGGESGAKERRMSYMVGGAPDLVDRCLPLFEASGSKITRAGPVGAAMRAKVVHQLIVCVNMLAASEGMRLGLAAGLSPQILTQVVREGAAQSRMADNWFTLSLRPHAVGVFDKDLDLCLKLAAELGVAAPGAELAKQKIDEIIP